MVVFTVYNLFLELVTAVAALHHLITADEADIPTQDQGRGHTLHVSTIITLTL